jgi:hypothetical protein
VTSFLIDEMFPPAAAELLRSTHGYDAVHVTEIGLGAADDSQVAAAARAEGRQKRPPIPTSATTGHEQTDQPSPEHH